MVLAEGPWLLAYWPVSGLTGQNWTNEPAGGGEREPRSVVCGVPPHGPGAVRADLLFVFVPD